jgi:hypothetical protein
MPKAQRKERSNPRPALRIVRGVPLPKVPRSIEAAVILSASPIIVSEIPGYFDALSDNQLRIGWRAVLTTALYEELSASGAYPAEATKGMIAAFLRSMHVVHDRRIQEK